MRIKNLAIVASLMALSVLLGCGKSDEKPNITSAQLKKLSGEWSLSSVRKEGVLQTGYENFSVSLSGSTNNDVFNYSVSGRPSLSPWPPSGSWLFGSDVETQIVRDPDTVDELTMTYTSSDNSLQILFDFDQSGYPNRSESVGGSWTFVFSKN